jgi:hypothetical protein
LGFTADHADIADDLMRAIRASGGPWREKSF